MWLGFLAFFSFAPTNTPEAPRAVEARGVAYSWRRWKTNAPVVWATSTRGHHQSCTPFET